MPNPLLDIRIGTMVRANLDDPAGYVRQILPLGFESIQPFFWQTLGGKDMSAACRRAARGDRRCRRHHQLHRRVRQSAGGWRQGPRDARRLGNDHRQRASVRRRHRQRLHRPHPRQAADRQPAALPRSLGRACQARGGQGRAHRLRELRDGWQLGDRRLEHRPQSRRLGADVQRDCRTTISGSNGSPATSSST